MWTPAVNRQLWQEKHYLNMYDNISRATLVCLCAWLWCSFQLCYVKASVGFWKLCSTLLFTPHSWERREGVFFISVCVEGRSVFVWHSNHGICMRLCKHADESSSYNDNFICATACVRTFWRTRMFSVCVPLCVCVCVCVSNRDGHWCLEWQG